MLTKNPKKRITAEKALKHAWFETDDFEDDLDPHILKSLKEYWGVSRLKQEAINVLVKTADND